LGHLWCSYWSNFCSCLGEIGSLASDLRNMDFSFCLWFCYYYFLQNSATYWRPIFPFIAISSYLFYLFYKVSLH
jgi:hypothetical protein